MVAVVVVATGVDRAIVPEGGVVVGNLEVLSALPWVFVESTGGPINIVRNAHTRHLVDAVRNSDVWIHLLSQRKRFARSLNLSMCTRTMEISRLSLISPIVK